MNANENETLVQFRVIWQSQDKVWNTKSLKSSSDARKFAKAILHSGWATHEFPPIKLVTVTKFELVTSDGMNCWKEPKKDYHREYKAESFLDNPFAVLMEERHQKKQQKKEKQ